MEVVWTRNIKSEISPVDGYNDGSSCGYWGWLFSAAAEKYRWKGSDLPFPLASPLSQHTIVLWKKYVEEMSGGRMEIVLHDANEIVPITKFMMQFVTAYSISALTLRLFRKARYPAGDLFYTLPAGVFNFKELILWLYAGGGKELEQEMYGDELIVFPLGLTPPEEIWSKKPINTLEDIKGIKIRAAGLSMEMWEKLGASVVLLAGGEVLPALQRGMIDATEYLEASYDYKAGFHEVCKYRFGPPIHMSNNIFQLLIKTESWEKLPADLKAIVERAAVVATFQGYADFWQETIEYNMKIEEYGTITTRLSKEDQDRARVLAMEIIDEKAAADPFFKKVWESQKAFLKDFKPYYELTKFD